jgi:hypothetical protein
MKLPKIVYIIIIILIASLSVLLWVYVNSNSKLTGIIVQKDSMLNDIRFRDSIYAEKTKEYSSIISKYFTNCKFTINNKQISMDQIIDLYNKSLVENDRLLDSFIFYQNLYNKCSAELDKTQIHYLYEKRSYDQLYKITDKYADSAQIFNKLLKTIIKHYGLKLDYSRSKGTINLNIGVGMADSALMLLPFYRNMIEYDSSTKIWNVYYGSIQESYKIEQGILKKIKKKK